MPRCVSKCQEQQCIHLKALQGTQAVNPGLQLPHNRQPCIKLSDGTRIDLKPCTTRRQLLLKSWGCTDGFQHYKRCQPKSVQTQADLLCPFCTGSTAAWREAGRAQLIPAEQQFMQLLHSMGVSQRYCHQVYHSCWSGRFDFYNWKQDVLVQVDDSTHWCKSCRGRVLMRDLRCNMSTFCARAALVRVHVNDLQRPDAVFAAIATAAACCAVVFTPGFKAVGFQQVQKLRWRLWRYSRQYTDEYGNMVFARRL